MNAHAFPQHLEDLLRVRSLFGEPPSPSGKCVRGPGRVHIRIPHTSCAFVCVRDRRSAGVAKVAFLASSYASMPHLGIFPPTGPLLFVCRFVAGEPRLKI